MMKKIMTTMAVLALVAVSLQAGPKVEMKYSGPSGQGNLIWWAPSSGITNMVMTTNGITVFSAAPGSAVVWTNASLTITRQVNASVTNVTTATQGNPSVTNIAWATYIFTNKNSDSTNVFTNYVPTIQYAALAALTNVTVQVGAVKAVTNVVLSNP
jgi:hypothetical protein